MRNNIIISSSLIDGAKFKKVKIMARIFKNKPSREELREGKIKANRRGNREAEMENESGFVSRTKVFKNKKAYCRKNLKLS
jgi:hypothetical protein